jgi:replicative DNA helicase
MGVFMPESLQAAAALDLNTEALKVPPHSIQAEQSVLGGLMLENSAWDEVADRLTEEDFYRYDHRLIFEAIRTLVDQGSPYDVITLSEWLGKQDALDTAGGLAYLGTLAKNTPSAANIRAYAEIVREYSVLRQLIGVATSIANSGYFPEGRDAKELVDHAEQQVFQIAEQGSHGRNGFVRIKDLLSARWTRSTNCSPRQSHHRRAHRLQRPRRDDRRAAEFGPGHRRRPASMGKTTFAMNIAENAAIASRSRSRCSAWKCPGSSWPCA